jgi:hypothetical protein
MIGPSEGGAGSGPALPHTASMPGPYFVEFSHSKQCFEVVSEQLAMNTNLMSYLKGPPRDAIPIGRLDNFEAAMEYMKALTFLKAKATLP